MNDERNSRDKKALSVKNCKNRKLHEATCNRVHPNILQRYHQFAALLGVTSHKRTEKLQDIS